MQHNSIYSQVLFGKKAKNKLMDGVRVMSEAVSSTLGPLGQNVAIAYAAQSGDIWQRIVVHDGVTVARAVSLKDEFEDMGAQLLAEASRKQVQQVGDGTTVSIVLARAILEEVSELIAAGVNPMLLRRGIEQGVALLEQEIDKISVPINTFEQLKHIATVSAEDTELGNLVAKVIEEMGTEGLVVVEESKNSDTTVEKQEGMQLDKGFAHPFFMTNPDKGEATLENPLVLCTDKPVNTLLPLKKIIEHCSKSGKSLVLFAPTVGNDALAAMVQNKLSGAVYSLVINAPSFGLNQKNILADIAIYTGARFITEDAADRFEDTTPADLGKAEYISATKTETIIVGGKGKAEEISLRVKEIENNILSEEVEFDREKLKERLAKFTTGVAVIKVGGHTEVEMKERLERVKDAKEASRAALKSGIVSGGEVVFLQAREVLKPNGKANLGKDLLYKALYEPFKTLLLNSGLNDGEYFEKLKHTKVKNAGVEVLSGEIKDMIIEGIIDPSAVAKSAIKNAASVSIQLATTGTVVIQTSNK